VSGSLNASDALFAREYNEALVHQLVTAYLANARLFSLKKCRKIVKIVQQKLPTFGNCYMSCQSAQEEWCFVPKKVRMKSVVFS
ncbi:MAG: hypothetical protein IIT57_12070, partial [Treponema sp.]|nr:hypothetical protein [Treponema sp.]